MGLAVLVQLAEGGAGVGGLRQEAEAAMGGVLLAGEAAGRQAFVGH